MNQFNIKIILISLFIYGLLTQSCGSQSSCPPCPARPSVNPNIDFRMLSRINNEDLFFGASPAYSSNEIKVFHIQYGKPTLLDLKKDTDRHLFNLNVPTIHRIDTITIQIAGLKMDTILFKTSSTNSCCPQITLNTVLFNNFLVFSASDTAKIVILKK